MMLLNSEMLKCYTSVLKANTYLEKLLLDI